MSTNETEFKVLFPTGEWDSGCKQWMVLHGQYHCAVAVVKGDSYDLTLLGKALLAAEEKPPAVEAEDVELPKRKTRKSKQLELGLDSLDG